MVDIFDRLKKAEGDLGQYRSKSDGYFMFPILEGEIGPHMKFNGKEVLNWSLNNYLGLECARRMPKPRHSSAWRLPWAPA